MSRDITKLILGAFLLVLFSNNVSAQTGNWSTQGASGCSDQYGSFDAFIPGMRGFGSCNRGGFVPGTAVYEVTTLSGGTGTGTLRAAASASCPKVILFNVSGLIHTSGSTIQMNACTNWSLVGASAPGNVTLTGSTDGVLSTNASVNFTIDHLTIAPGDTSIQSGGIGNRDAMWIGSSAGGGPGILLNNNLVWGADETVSCYNSAATDNILYWQNIIGRPVAGSGVHILQNRCRNNNSIRNFYVHSHGRMPLVRGDNYFHANNFTVNPGYATVNIQPCAGTYSPIDNQVRMNFINNLMARGVSSGSHEHIEASSSLGCTAFSIHESGTNTMNASFQIEDCSNHGCTSGLSGFQGSPIASAYPTGYVAEPIAVSQQGYADYATKVTSFAGAHPTNRLAYFSELVSMGINHVDGSGDRGSYSSANGGTPNTVVQEGGVGVITPPQSSRNASSQCGGMPTGGAADAIQSSGLTALHEWVIGCFYDNVMPAGYREDSLPNPSPPPPAPPPPTPTTPNPPDGFG